MHICCFIKGTLRWHKKCTFSGWVSLAKNANYFCWSKKKKILGGAALACGSPQQM